MTQAGIGAWSQTPVVRIANGAIADRWAWWAQPTALRITAPSMDTVQTKPIGRIWMARDAQLTLGVPIVLMLGVTV